MKNLLSISESEKKRILNLHETRRAKEFGLLTEAEYLNQDRPGDPYQYLKVDDGTTTKYYFKGIKGDQLKKYPNWVEAKGTGLDSIKNKVTFKTTAETSSQLSPTSENPNNNNNTPTSEQQKEDENWKKYPCVTSNPNAVKGNANGSIHYTIGNETYYNNGRVWINKTPTNYYCDTNNKIVKAIDTLPTKPLSAMTITNDISNRQLATGQNTVSQNTVSQNTVSQNTQTPTTKEIKQGLRRRKRINNRMDRQQRKQLDNLYDQYENVAGQIQKLGPRDDGSIEFRTQMSALEDKIKSINAQIDKLERS